MDPKSDALRSVVIIFIGLQATRAPPRSVGSALNDLPAGCRAQRGLSKNNSRKGAGRRCHSGAGTHALSAPEAAALLGNVINHA